MPRPSHAVLRLLAVLSLAAPGFAFGTVYGRLQVAPSLDPAGIRVRLQPRGCCTGGLFQSGIWLGETLGDGRFTLKPGGGGRTTFLVARDRRFDAEVGPLGVMGPGASVELSEFLPTPHEVLDQPLPRVEPRLTLKRAGRAKFVYVDGGMAPRRLLRVEVIGDFNDFSLVQGGLELFDDGSRREIEDESGRVTISGDAEANDGVYVRVVEGLPPGRLHYRLLLDRSLLLLADPFEEEGEQTPAGWASVIEIP